MSKYKLHRFDKFPFGKYKHSRFNISNLIYINLNYVLWFQELENIEYSKCITDKIEEQKKVLYNQKIDNIIIKKHNNKKTKLYTDNFLEYSGLEEAFRNSYFN